MSTDLKFHPLAGIFPLMKGAEFDELVADIKANGLGLPIILYKGMILDGRNRYRALHAFGVPPEFIRDHCCVTPDCIDEQGGPAAYVISANIRRRHLAPEDKIKILAQWWRRIRRNPTGNSPRKPGSVIRRWPRPGGKPRQLEKLYQLASASVPTARRASSRRGRRASARCAAI